MQRLAPSQPEAFPDIDLSKTGVVIPEGTAPELLAAGFNSSAWRIGSQVLKVTKQSKNPVDAIQLLRTMRREDAALRDFIGDFMPDTEYNIGWQTGTNLAHVVSVQPFVEGTALSTFTARRDIPTDPLREFLVKSKEFFKAERLMPDIACVEDQFNVLVNSNILILEDEDAKPELVDTTFGKTQRSKSLGPLWTRFIYAGAVIADRRLQIERR